MNAASTGNATLDHFRATRTMRLDLTTPPTPAVFGLAKPGDVNLGVDADKALDVDLTLPGADHLRTHAYQVNASLGIGGKNLQLFSTSRDVVAARAAVRETVSAVGFDADAIDSYLAGLDAHSYTHMSFSAPPHGYLSLDVEIRTYAGGTEVVALYGLTWDSTSP